MSKLNENWLTEKHIDFELKKYTLLSYLQNVQEQYKNNKVYPSLQELIRHYKNLLSIRENASGIKDNMVKDVSGFDLKSWKVNYTESFQDDEIFITINEIINYSLPLFAKSINDGKIIYDFVEEHINIEAVGISPLNTTEGYLLLHCKTDDQIYAYQYALSFYENKDERHRTLSTNYIQNYTSCLSNTFLKVKSDLISNNKELPNPAVYAINCDLSVPLKETFLPIAKRYFICKMGY